MNIYYYERQIISNENGKKFSDIQQYAYFVP